MQQNVRKVDAYIQTHPTLTRESPTPGAQPDLVVVGCTLQSRGQCGFDPVRGRARIGQSVVTRPALYYDSLAFARDANTMEFVVPVPGGWIIGDIESTGIARRTR